MTLAPIIPIGSRPPELDERLETLFAWLDRHDLVGEGGRMDLPPVDHDHENDRVNRSAQRLCLSGK